MPATQAVHATHISMMDAFRVLGVDPFDLQRLPSITPQLRQISATIKRKGQPRIIETATSVSVALVEGQQVGPSRRTVTRTRRDTELSPPAGPGSNLLTSWPYYLDASDHADARAVLTAYRSIPNRLARVLPIEAFCVKADISPLRILELITGVCVRLGAQASTIIAAVNHPRIVEKTVEMALRDEGVADRNTLHKATGFLPTPKTAQTLVQVSQVAQVAAHAFTASESVESADQTTRRLVDRFNDARGAGGDAVPDSLPASSSPSLPDLGGDLVPVSSFTAEPDALVIDDDSDD